MTLGSSDAVAWNSPANRLSQQMSGSTSTTSACQPVANARISRVQLVMQPDGDNIRLRSVGRAPMRVNGVQKALPASSAAGSAFAFGEPDGFGLIGEAEAAWALRHTSWLARQELHQVRKLGRYQLEARLGKGTQGEVWLARDASLDRDVALKILRGFTSRWTKPAACASSSE